MTTQDVAGTQAIDELSHAVRQLAEAIETIAGLVDLGAEAVFVRENLDEATRVLDSLRSPVPGG